jgi:hypothetical protein
MRVRVHGQERLIGPPIPQQPHQGHTPPRESLHVFCDPVTITTGRIHR